MFEIYIDDSLGFTIRVFGKLLPENHVIYKSHLRSIRYLTVSSLMQEVENTNICQGVSIPSSEGFQHIKKHVIPKKFVLFSKNDEDTESKSEGLSKSRTDEYLRSIDCSLLNESGADGKCTYCLKMEMTVNKTVRSARAISLKPASKFAPVSLTSPDRLCLTLREYRKENKSLKKEITELRVAIEKSAIPISENLHNDLKDIFHHCDHRNITPFMKLFWEEQMKYVKSTPSQVRYHPSVIKFCLGLYAKSPAAYDQLRLNEKDGTGILILPSKRTLRDYKNYIKPTRGFNFEVIKDLKTKTQEFSDVERYVVISFDEMKVQEDLVWDKHTGELIGFVDLGDANLNHATFDKSDDVATHVLVFLVKSVVNPLSFSFATFSTKGVTSHQLFPIFWKAVAYLEIECSLKVIAATSDGASPNRRFYKMHDGFYQNENVSKVTYKTPNLFANDGRFIWFFFRYTSFDENNT